MTNKESVSMSMGATSLAIYANIVISIAYMFAFIYAAMNLGGDASFIFWFLAVVAGVSVLATTAAKIVVDVSWGLIRKADALDKAKDKQYTKLIRTADKA